jgi:hypothetical protein
MCIAVVRCAQVLSAKCVEDELVLGCSERGHGDSRHRRFGAVCVTPRTNPELLADTEALKRKACEHNASYETANGSDLSEDDQQQ